LCTRKVMIADRLAECPGAAVNHQPEPIFLVPLEFEKVIPAAESCELQFALASPDRLQPGTAQFDRIQALRLSNDSLPIATPAGDCLCESRQNLASCFRVTQQLRSRVRCYCQHSEADVTTHCLRVDQMRGCQHH